MPRSQNGKRRRSPDYLPVVVIRRATEGKSSQQTVRAADTMEQQPSIEELLNKHKAQVAELSSLVNEKASNLSLERLSVEGKEDELFYTPVDDIFFLRHILSKKDKTSLQELAQDVVHGLEWRLSKLDKAKEDDLGIGSKLAYAYTGDLPNGSPVAVLSLKQSKLKSLLKLNEAKLDEYMKYEKESLYQLCDKRTRAKNVLVKAVTLVDAKDIGVYQGRVVYKVLMLLNKNRDFKPHPQLQVPTVVVNVPYMARSLTKGVKKVMSTTLNDFHQKFDAKEAVPSFVGGNAKWNFSQSSSVGPRKNSSVIEERTEHWKLKKGNSYTWDIPITRPDAILSCICDTQSDKIVEVSGTMLDENNEVKVDYSPVPLKKQVLSFRTLGETGKFQIKIENPGNKIVGKMKRRLKNKRASLGQITFRVEVPIDATDADLFLDEKKAGSESGSGGQNMDLKQRIKEIRRKVNKEEAEETEEDTGKQFNLPEDSWAAWLKWLIPTVPDIIIEAIMPENTQVS